MFFFLVFLQGRGLVTVNMKLSFFAYEKFISAYLKIWSCVALKAYTLFFQTLFDPNANYNQYTFVLGTEKQAKLIGFGQNLIP